MNETKKGASETRKNKQKETKSVNHIKLIPVPSTRDGWLLAIIIIIISYMLYYFIAYPLLTASYRNEQWSKFGDAILVDDDTKNLLLNVDIRIPKHVSDFVKRNIEVVILNGTDEKLPAKFSIVPDKSKNSAVIEVYANSKDSERTKRTSTIYFENIYPHSQVKAIFDIVVHNGDDDQEIILNYFLDGKKLEVRTVPKHPKFNRLSTLVYTGLNAILLPPWSNGLLPLVVLFIVWISESYFWYRFEENNKIFIFLEKILSVWIVYILFCFLAMFLAVPELIITIFKVLGKKWNHNIAEIFLIWIITIFLILVINWIDPIAKIIHRYLPNLHLLDKIRGFRDDKK